MLKIWDVLTNHMGRIDWIPTVAYPSSDNEG